MDLADALGGSEWPSQNNPQSGPPNQQTWPGQPGVGQPGQPMWPGQPGPPGGQPGQPTWPGQQPNPSQPMWPGQPGVGQPTWPGQPGQPGGQPGQPMWPGQPGQPGGQPGQPMWPGQPGQPGGQPGQPMWPGQPGQPGGQPGQPMWPGQPGQPGGQPGQPMWPGQPGVGQPGQPTWPGQPGQPTAPGWPNSVPGLGPGPGLAPPTAPQQTPLKIPYKQHLPLGCYDRMVITILGTVSPKAKMITLNLSKGNDVALHVNPRFDEMGKKTIVCNSLIGPHWGKEERINNFPFIQGQPFEMKIMCTNSEFKVAVNSKHILDFKHRIRDLASINILDIYSDVTLTSVDINSI